MSKIVRVSAIVAMLLVSKPVFAQQGVHVSNDDPRWGEKITVSYIAPSGSTWASPDNPDTLYCAANVRGVRPEHAIIQPMRHVIDSLYETELTVPDSTYKLWVEICIPTDRVPDGITVFTCRTADGRPTPGSLLEATMNIDSALDADLALYPKDYTAYVKAYDKARELSQAGAITITDSAWKPMLLSYTQQLLDHPDNSPSWHLAVSSIYSLRGRDSLANSSLTNAVRVATVTNPELKSMDDNPIFNDMDYWGHVFGPHMTKGKLSWPMIPARILAPLIERYPRTAMALQWIRLSANDTLVDANIFKHVAAAWTTSKDVDVLSSIGQAYGYKKGPLYDPNIALTWYTRAEESSRSHSGFFSGENIYSSMGRMGHILAGKANLLSTLGRPEEAITIARTAMTQAKQQFEKQEISGVLARAYLAAGRIEDAKRAFGMTLSSSTKNTMEGLDALYEKCKQGRETQAEFAKRLVDQYGHDVDLPSVPDFAFTTLDGITGTLAGLRGKVVVLDCWFTTCAGCVIEKNSLNKLVDSYSGDTNVVFLSIALNDAGTIKRFLERTPSKFKIVPEGQAICDKLGVSGYPTHIIIGRDGKTLGFEMGGSETEGESMRPKIERALGKI